MGKRKSRRRKQYYDPIESLKPTRLDPALEQVARELYEKACCGSKKHGPEIDSGSEFKKDSAVWKKFFSAAHNGMRAAQDHIIDRVQSGSTMSGSEQLLYRDISDSIAYQFLGGQLCHARRLFLGHKQPNLKQSNFESVVATARSIVDKSPDAMPLLSDLTTFVQVGDILSFDPERRLSIIEVKEGAVNQRISSFLNFYEESRCDRALGYFLASEGPHTANQMQRMMRQIKRMEHVKEVIASGKSVDPDTGLNIHIPEEFIPVGDWNEELNTLLQQSGEHGWAFDVIDDCLFVACYADGLMLPDSHLAFNMWFEYCGGTPECPRARMMDSMHVPLALPVFLRSITAEDMFDLLFGRKQIYMGLNIEALIKKCEKAGLIVRPGTNRETSRINQAGAKPYRHDGKSIFIGNGRNEMVLMDGIFLRAFFHGQKPVSIIESYLSADNFT
ncbi:MAG: hypothetical protein M0Q44_22270 [Methylobacter sp.]|jgi:hypothetical protein|nr:hypothetical protein [Methylobacter sp.]